MRKRWGFLKIKNTLPINNKQDDFGLIIVFKIKRTNLC